MKIEQQLLPREIFLNAPPEVKPHFQQLVELLTPWMRDINTLINKRISFTDNMACMFVDLDFIYPEPTPTITLQNSITEWGVGQKSFTLHKRDGWVDISFFLRHSGSGGNVTITTLPATYWPAGGESYLPGTVGQQPAAFTIDNGDGSVDLVYHAISGSGANEAIAFSHRYRAANPDPVSPGGFFPHFVNVTALGAKPVAIIPVACGRVASKRTAVPQALPEVTWDITTDGKKESIRILDLPGLSAGHRYRVRLLLVT
jgi:hypothetical protein